MDNLLTASVVALWVVVLLLTMALLALARQVGLLHARFPAFGARTANAGLDIGQSAPTLRVTDIFGREVVLEATTGRRTLLVFMAPGCASCARIAPAVRSVSASERRDMDTIVVSVGGDDQANRAFARRHRLDRIPFVVSEIVSDAFEVAESPYALMLDDQHVVRAKGLVNNLEQLTSLINAAQIGHPTLEAHLRATDPELAASLGDSVSAALLASIAEEG